MKNGTIQIILGKRIIFNKNQWQMAQFKWKMAQSKWITGKKTNVLFMKEWCWWTVQYWRALSTLTLFLFGRQYLLNDIRDLLARIRGCRVRRHPFLVLHFNYKGSCTYYVTLDGGVSLHDYSITKGCAETWLQCATILGVLQRQYYFPGFEKKNSGLFFS